MKNSINLLDHKDEFIEPSGNGVAISNGETVELSEEAVTETVLSEEQPEVFEEVPTASVEEEAAQVEEEAAQPPQGLAYFTAEQVIEMAGALKISEILNSFIQFAEGARERIESLTDEVDTLQGVVTALSGDMEEIAVFAADSALALDKADAFSVGTEDGSTTPPALAYENILKRDFSALLGNREVYSSGLGKGGLKGVTKEESLSDSPAVEQTPQVKYEDLTKLSTQDRIAQEAVLLNNLWG